MKVTNGEIHDSYRAIKEVMESSEERAIPQTGKYRLAKLHRKLEPLFIGIERQRSALVEQFGEPTFLDEEKTMPTGWSINQQGPNMPVYLEKWAELRSIEVEIDTTPISLHTLGESDKGLTTMEFGMLGSFIEG